MTYLTESARVADGLRRCMSAPSSQTPDRASTGHPTRVTVTDRVHYQGGPSFAAWKLDRWHPRGSTGRIGISCGGNSRAQAEIE